MSLDTSFSDTHNFNPGVDKNFQEIEKIRKYLDSLNYRSKEFSDLVYSHEDQKKKDLFEFRFGVPLAKIPAYCMEYVKQYEAYLNETAGYSFLVHGIHNATGEHTWKQIPYIHRWSYVYRQSILAKLMQLQEAIGEEIKECTMITLTAFQKGLTYEQSLKKLMYSYTCLRKVLTKHYGALDYFLILEPHKTGYAHIHFLYCKILNWKQKTHIRTLWAEKYHAGDKQYGIHFSEARRSINGEFSAGSIKKIKSYLMKYLVKGLYQLEMSPAELVFNATLKKTKTRLWNSSRNFSKIMARKIEPRPDDWECLEVFMQDVKKQGDETVLWSKSNGFDHSDYIKEWEHYITTSSEAEFKEFKNDPLNYKYKISPVFQINKHGVETLLKNEYIIYKSKFIWSDSNDKRSNNSNEFSKVTLSRRMLRKIYRNVLNVSCV